MNKKTLIRDIILIAVLFALALGAYLIVEATKKDGAYAAVEYKGEEIARYPLNKDGVYTIQPERDYTENGEPIFRGGINVLVIKDGRARIESADCPDKLCVNFGWISRTGERTTCLPNRISVVIRGEGEDILESH